MKTIMEAKVREFLGLFHEVDIDFDRVASFFSADASYQAHVPGVEPLLGRDTIRAELERQLKLYGQCDFQIINLAFSDRQLFAERRDYVTQNGARVEVRVNAIFEFNDAGEIVNWREYWDMGSVQQQLGISSQEMSGYMEQA